MFFSSLMPILKGTNVNISLSSEGEKVRVIILPSPKDGNVSALSMPLSVAATPEELDEQLPTIIGQYCGARESLAETIANTTAILEAAKQEEISKAVKGHKAEKQATAAKTEIAESADVGSEQPVEQVCSTSKLAPKSESIDLSLF